MMHWPNFQYCTKREYSSDHIDCLLRVCVLGDGLVRVRYAAGGFFDESPTYGVSPDFKGEPCEVSEWETDDYFELQTKTLSIRIHKASLGVEFVSIATGVSLSRDEGHVDFSYNDWTGDYRTKIRKLIKPGEYFFGLGDKPCDLNLRGKHFEMWGVDHYAFKENSDPLYKNITFFLSLCEGISYGIFFDNTCRSYFDFGLQKENALSFGAEGGQMDYYFFHEPTPVEIIARYTRLTGLPSMPPLWSLGYHQSKWSYYPARTVDEVASAMREKRIPCDSVHLDIHHMENYRGFTWDPVFFPDPAGLVKRLEGQGVKTVIIVNPGIKIDHANAVWQSGFERDCYCRRHDGALMEGVAWPGNCHFPDFTNARVRAWWSDLMGERVSETGIRGLWNDLNEPVIFPDKTFPMDTRHEYDGRPCSHSKAHNVYGHCMASASWEALRKHGGGRRPFNLSRSGYAGMQRFTATWTGDNTSSWADLKMADFQCQRLAASGVSFAGSDAGGFLEYPTPELFCRWMQMAAFHVFFRNHSSGEYGGQEPWMFGEEVLEYVRNSIEHRYRLLPYLYTQFYHYSARGLPIIRSLALQCHQTDDTYWRGVEFFVGEHLYVVPVLHAEAQGASLFVPDGAWYSLWDNSPAGESLSDVWAEAGLERIPVFVRGGAVIPRWPVQQYVGEIDAPPLFLDLWWAGETACSSSHYDDAGDGMEHLEGDYALTFFDYASTAGSFEISCRREGDGRLRAGSVALRLHAMPLWCRSLEYAIDDAEVRRVDITDGECEIPVPEFFNRFNAYLKGGGE